jgi:hypothetical protein
VDIVLDVDSLAVDIVEFVEDDHNQVLEHNHLLDASLDNLEEVVVVEVVLVVVVAFVALQAVVVVLVVALAFAALQVVVVVLIEIV